MLVHDFRRARLADPELPQALLPKGWAGTKAYDRAAEIFHSVDTVANAYLSETLSFEITPSKRFAPA